MRVAVGGYLVAVNTFATQKMGLDLFQRATLSGERVLRVGGAQGSIAGFLHGARQYHWDIVPLPFVVPGVGGKVTTEAHEAAKAGFLDLLRKNPPVDGVFLQLHGTAVSDECDDCEGDVLRTLRECLGNKVPILATLDGHSNTTPLMVEQASMLIGVKTNPHYDFFPRRRTGGSGHGRHV